ncbi:MAG: hypothetical protein V7754_21850 [Halioglobus sp.]
MKIIRLVLVVLMLAPFASFAEEPLGSETQYTLTSGNFKELQDLLVVCAEAIPALPSELVFGWTATLHAQQVHKGNGKVLKNGAQVGQMTMCVGAGVEGLGPYGPEYQEPIAIGMIIGDQELRALGSIVRNDYSGTIATDPFWTFGISANVWRYKNGEVTDSLGTLMSNVLFGRDENGLIKGSNGLWTLRFFEPPPNTLQ